jgi:hypothetical protein
MTKMATFLRDQEKIYASILCFKFDLSKSRPTGCGETATRQASPEATHRALSYMERILRYRRISGAMATISARTLKEVIAKIALFIASPLIFDS